MGVNNNYRVTQRLREKAKIVWFPLLLDFFLGDQAHFFAFSCNRFLGNPLVQVIHRYVLITL